MTSSLVLGCDIGGTKTALLIASVRGEIVSRRQFATLAERGFAAVFEELVRHARDLLATHGPVRAVSVAIGGPLDVARGIIYSPPNLPGWDAVPLKEMLTRALNLPVFLEHDGNAGALAELYFGAGRGFRNIVFLTMGTGFGAGLILDGHLYRGSNDMAGEVGHLRIAETGPECYGKAGSLEGYASGSGIVRLAALMYPGRWGPATSVVDLHKEYRAGEAAARAVFDRAGFYLGRGLALLVDVLNPERIILGGLGMRMYDALVVPALRVYEHEALARARGVCSIVPAELGESIGDLASLSAALDQGGLQATWTTTL
jgi:glucokinase